MYGKLGKISTLVLVMGLLVGCAAESSSDSIETSWSIASEPSEVVDVNLAPPKAIDADWSLNVDDPAAVASFSSVIVAGSVVNIEETYVGPLDTIHTRYMLKVDKVYKGNLKVGDEISVSLPGGAMTLGDYIEELDRMGRYDDVFPVKGEEFLKEAGIDPATVVDPRDDDPNAQLIDNLGSNPTSESLNAEVAPDAWVYFLNIEDDGTYYGSVFNHSLKYVKGGQVFNLNPEVPEGKVATPFLESKLG